MDLFKNLNDKQKEAVKHTKGPLLILAGAGSGKTKTLTHRIAYILDQGLATEGDILAVTFTNKAAGEMRQRVAALCGENQNNRSFMPFLGTFHGICVRILRQEAENIGLSRQFVIFDSSDSLQAIKQVMRGMGIDEKRFNPNAIKSFISSAKNELIDSDSYPSLTSGPLQEVAAEVYPAYQRLLAQAQALDFDDLLLKTVRMFETNPETLQRWRDRFKYILVDEYQDTNHAQYQFVKLLAKTHKNICVVGDDWQCLHPDSLVETDSGSIKIKDVGRGDIVRSSSGYGKSEYFKVERKRKFNYKGELVHIKTASGKQIYCTPNHILFSRWDKTDNFFVYLMFSREKGYRIGIAKGTRYDGKKNDIGLRVRANQERAERMWVLKICSSKEEAAYNELRFSYKYNIPMLVFRAGSYSSTSISQEYIDAIYQEIDTHSGADNLMRDLDIKFDYPHFIPQATTRNQTKRINLNVVLFGDKRQTSQSPWSASRISINTADKSDLNIIEESGYTVRSGRADTYRTEIHHLDYGKIESIVDRLQSVDSDKMIINKYAFITNNKFIFTPASHIHPDMYVPIIDRGVVKEDKVIEVNRQYYMGPVYDLDVENVHNYSASGIVVHNSVYSWRGANFRNILDFERDYPNAKVVKLEQNYRSTKSILTAAQSVISKNQNRSDKNLWTDGEDGRQVEVTQVSNELEEAEAIMRYVKSSSHSLSDIAVLYRTNAQSRALEEVCIRYGVPYQIVGGVRFYERKEIKDMLAYLRFIYQPNDRVSFERIINLPPRGIGDRSLQQFFSWQQERGITLDQALIDVNECQDLSSRAINAFASFARLINGAKEQSMTPSELVEYLLKKTGYQEYIDDGSIQAAERLENIKELVTVTREFSEVGEFLEEVALISDLDGMKETSDTLTLMTLHAAKGLEFPVVFIVGLEEGVFPHSRSLFEPEQMEEERRLMYVGMTRAMEELYLLHARSRMLYGQSNSNPPARFIAEIGGVSTTDSAVSTAGIGAGSIDIDDMVKHPVFGEGLVIAVEGDEAIISFKKVGNKKLTLTYAPLERIE
ncbi:MAG: UvrD-helicase domain-containing protein [Candidatus Saccharimonadales bacterium]